MLLSACVRMHLILCVCVCLGELASVDVSQTELRRIVDYTSGHAYPFVQARTSVKRFALISSNSPRDICKYRAV